MPRITPSSGATIDLTVLEDHEPYAVTLKTIDSEMQPPFGKPDGPLEKRLVLDWELENEETLRDWVGLKLGKSKDSGAVSKLRQLLNALAGKPEGTEIAWFDSDTYEWGYDSGADSPAYDKLYEGQEVIVRGKHGKKKDDSPKFTITVYQPVKRKLEAAGTKKGLKPAQPQATAVDPDEIPF